MGYAGKILRIDLLSNRSWAETIKEEFIKRYIGGKGLAYRYLHDDAGKFMTAFSPVNDLIISTGPLTGTLAPNGGRFSVATYGMDGSLSSSSAGGLFGVFMKSIGYDMIIVSGRSQSPVWISIDSSVKFMNANELWRKGTSETISEISKNFRDHKSATACIGPAGENLVPFSSIIFDGYISVSKNGMGAVMGSKNLKAISINGIEHLILKENPDEAFLTTVYEKIKKLAVGKSSPEWSSFDGNPCYLCPLQCGRYNQFTGNDHWHEAGKAFIKNCGLDNESLIKQIIAECNRLGIDAVSAGCALCDGGPVKPDLIMDALRSIANGDYLNFASCKNEDHNSDRQIKTILDSAGLCAFTSKIFDLEDYKDLINADLKSNFSVGDLLKIADEIDNL